ncbi:MAG: hypothetical protein NTX86_02710 [Candidatus Dependentiae bacterium]|nr:hypothetical protein [Candidatus Dependentiae bacterium]
MLKSKQSYFNLVMLSAIFISSSSFGMMTQISGASVQKLGEAKRASLFHDGESFQVNEDGQYKEVPNYLVDKNIRNVDTARLSKILAHGYLTLNKNSEGEFSVKENGRLNGGGPITGAVLYWLTKSLCWGGVGAAAGAGITAAVVATGGGAAAAAIGAAGSAVITATATSTLGATAVAGAIATSATATAIATTASGAAIATAAATGAGTVGLVAGIEAASMAAWAAGTLCPFCP